MSAFTFSNSPAAYVEITQGALRVAMGERALDLPVARMENGQIEPACRAKLVAAVREFLQQERPGRRAVCAIGARGVSLRRLTVPAAGKEELQRVLHLQIEREFPLAPSELAWGAGRVNGNGSESVPQDVTTGNGHRDGRAQEFLVVAVKRELLREYSDLLSECGLEVSFTVGALARRALAPKTADSFALLDIGATQSELLTCEHGTPAAIRILPWGVVNVVLALQRGLGITHDEAQRYAETEPAGNGDAASNIRQAIAAECAALTQSLRSAGLKAQLYVTGGGALLRYIAPQLGDALGTSVRCEALQASGPHSAAIAGLKRACEADGPLPLFLDLQPVTKTERVAQPSRWRWVALAITLAVVAVSLRYVEAVVQKPRLSRKIADLRSYRDRLPALEKELAFLQHLKTNQPPYVDLFTVLAEAAPSGARVESLSLNRRGELSMRATMRGADAVNDLRSKLIKSGWFSSVVVDDQTTSPDRQKVNVRITALWQPGPTPTVTARPSPGTRTSTTSIPQSGRGIPTAPTDSANPAAPGPRAIPGSAAPAPISNTQPATP